MKILTKAECKTRFFALKNEAISIANLRATTPDKCDDPLCEMYRRLLMSEFMEDELVVVANDAGLPLFFLTEFHQNKQSRDKGIMAVEGDVVKNIREEDDLLVVTYTDDSVERYAYFEPADAYYFHSNNRLPFDLTEIQLN